MDGQDDNDDNMSPEATGRMIGGKDKPIAKQTLARWRCEGIGPPFVKCGRRVAYPRKGVKEWMASRCFRSTSEASNASQNKSPGAGEAPAGAKLNLGTQDGQVA